MAKQPVNLNAKRAEAAGDCRLQTPRDMLEEALAAAADRDWTKAILILHKEDPQGVGKQVTHISYAGLTALETRGLLLTAIRAEFLDE